MVERLSIHVLDDDYRRRAMFSRQIMELGHHAEVYSDPGELFGYGPRDGVILALEDAVEGGIAGLVRGMTKGGFWLPIIASSMAPTIEGAVRSIKAGALEYLPIPLERERLGAAIETVLAEARSHQDRRVRHVHAKALLAKLSPREYEVLDLLSNGFSNKEIAREMGISHRTVEIHRMNALVKIGARHSAEAVRLRLEASAFDGVN